MNRCVLLRRCSRFSPPPRFVAYVVTVSLNALGDININNSKINVNGRDRGGINLKANHLNIEQGNIQVEVGINDQLERATNQAGDIRVNVNQMTMNNSVLAQSYFIQKREIMYVKVKNRK